MLLLDRTMMLAFVVPPLHPVLKLLHVFLLLLLLQVTS
jgi:hypothetical protein